METTITLSGIRDQFRSALQNHYSAGEINQLFTISTEYLLNYAKIDTFLRAEEPISPEISEKYTEILTRLSNWEPIQYITGQAWFYGLSFKVDKRVLIPRQETEELVDWIIKSEEGKIQNTLDIGTGSGCIAIALKKKLEGMLVSACDISEGALEVARVNAIANNVEVSYFRFDLLSDTTSLPLKYHTMVSNPPYVRKMEKQYMMRNVIDYEPALALFVDDDDPLLYYKRIALLARKYLLDGGCLYLEINEALSAEIKRLLECTGLYGIEVKNDINGKPRMVRARK